MLKIPSQDDLREEWQRLTPLVEEKRAAMEAVQAEFDEISNEIDAQRRERLDPIGSRLKEVRAEFAELEQERIQVFKFLRGPTGIAQTGEVETPEA